jgi:ubiquinone/menaquinone biosynthesis C-methylase UbiE
MAKHYDEDAARRLEALYSTPDIVEQRRRTLHILALQPGERVLDIGCGPGYLAAEMANAVGAQGRVCGIDVSEPMLKLARRRCAALDRVDLKIGDASRLPFDDATFDAAAAIQVYLYVNGVDSALAELHRVLRPGGRAVVMDTDWGTVAWNTANPELMKRVLAVWETRFVHSRLARSLPGRLRSAGFELTCEEVVPLMNTRYDPESYSGMQINEVVGFVAGRDGITHEEANAWASELLERGRTGDYFFSLNRYLFLVRKSEAA